MHEAEVGWIAAIIIGGLAGWLAETFMKSGTGILMNVVLDRWRRVGQLAAGLVGDLTWWMARLSDRGLHRGVHHHLLVARRTGTDRLAGMERASCSTSSCCR